MPPYLGFVARRLLAQVRRLRRRALPPELTTLLRRTPVKLHLGCGDVHLRDWINVDVSPNSAADVVMDFRYLGDALPASSVDEVMMIHSLSYLRLWEARDLLAALNRMLKPGSKFIAEFPDAEKCAMAIAGASRVVTPYLEAVRGFYAFDMGQIAARKPYAPYAFGWAAWHLEQELLAAGFVAVRTLHPLTHGSLTWRDSRVEATK